MFGNYLASLGLSSPQSAPGGGLFPLDEPGVYDGYNHDPWSGGNAVAPGGLMPQAKLPAIDPFAVGMTGYQPGAFPQFELGGGSDATSTLADMYESELQRRSQEEQAKQLLDEARTQQWLGSASTSSAFDFRPRPLTQGAPLGPGADADAYNAAFDARMDYLAPSAPASPVPGMGGVMDAASDFRNTAMGLFDRNTGGNHRYTDSPEYWSAITGGGRDAQNDRAVNFWQNFDDQAASLARQDLAANPIYGHHFQPQDQARVTSNDLGGAGMTFFGQPSSNEVSPAYLAASQMTKFDFPTGSAGRELGGLAGSRVSFKTPEAEAAFRAKRAERQAEEEASRPNMRPLMIDSLPFGQRMNVLAQWQKYQDELGLDRDKLALDRSTADRAAGIDQQKVGLMGQELALKQQIAALDHAYRTAESAAAREDAKTLRDLKVQELANAGKLTQKETIEIIYGDIGKGLGGPEAARAALREDGALPSIPFGEDDGPTYQTSTAATSSGGPSLQDILADPYGNQQAFVSAMIPNRGEREKIDAMNPQQVMDWTKVNPKPGGGAWTDADRMALVKWANPDAVGISPRNPAGWSTMGALASIPLPILAGVPIARGASWDGPLELLLGETGNLSRNWFGQPY